MDKINKSVYIQVSKKGALGDVRYKISNALKIQYDTFKLKDFKATPKFGIADQISFQYELYQSNKHPTKEAYTYGFINTLLSNFFRPEKGFIVVAQSSETDGNVDFLLKRNGKAWAVVKSKAKGAKYFLTQLYTQALNYAEFNHNSELCYVIVNKGTYISFGIYTADFHSMNKINKFVFFDGYLGLESDNVKPVPQRKPIELQHRLYKITNSGNIEQNRCVSNILEYMARNKIDLSKLDWGPKHKTEYNGGILKK